ncbi:hypothetical protein PMKS-003862 [Pichia membranifaciens]|uniref:Uncharacterized protein n=1 Tax=Pichia membranifaciens TaxID=4926 RepID=A0A1Q2YLJ0_9ASCO|nr:hypothetical protein PMKS-003862 [Pichia membranifaciens]
MSQGVDAQAFNNFADEEMKMLIGKEDWDSIHGLLMECLKNNETDNIVKSDKDKIVTEYTDFRQLQESNSNGAALGAAAGMTVGVAGGDCKGTVDTKLTQHSWSYPVDFTPDDLGVLYDMTMSGIDLENKDENRINDEVAEARSTSIDDLNNMANQTSGVFTLSQVLGENTQRSLGCSGKQKENVKGHIQELDCIIIEDSCDSDCAEDEITLDYIEKIREEKAESGTQQLPIELDSSNIIEIPNSSDDGGDDDGDFLGEIGSINLMNTESEVIEIANSSTCGDSDSDILLTGCPESGTQPLIDLNHLQQESELMVDHAVGSYERMIVPTSSPASSAVGSQEINVNDDNVFTRSVTEAAGRENENLVDNVAAVLSEIPDEPVTEEERVVVDIVVDIEKRMKHFEGWTVVMLKKQLGEWGVKNASKMGKKKLEETLLSICKNISSDKWDWAVDKFQTGEVLKFAEWESEHSGDVGEAVVTDMMIRKAVMEQIKVLLKEDSGLYYDVLRYKPLNLNMVLGKLAETSDRKVVCDCLDGLGICWTEVG